MRLLGKKAEASQSSKPVFPILISHLSQSRKSKKNN